MIIQDITLRNFRNYREMTLLPHEGVNLFFGANGSGKTNLLEAIHYCALGKSHRVTGDQSVIRIGETITGKISYIGTSKDIDTMSVFIEFDQENPPLKDGDYDAVLVLDAKTPISFLWNN